MNDLGGCVRDASVGDGINNAGQVTGYSLSSSLLNSAHIFLYSNGHMTDLVQQTFGGRMEWLVHRSTRKGLDTGRVGKAEWCEMPYRGIPEGRREAGRVLKTGALDVAV